MGVLQDNQTNMQHDADTINTINKESERETFNNITLIDDGHIY